MSDDLWERWKRGARVDDLAREAGCTRERMRYRLRKLEEGHAQADLAAELSRLCAEVERLTKEGDRLERQCFKQGQAISRMNAALADERRHADALAEAVTTLIEGGNRQLALISRKVRVTDPMMLTVTKGQLLAAIEARAAHRARRQG